LGVKLLVELFELRVFETAGWAVEIPEVDQRCLALLAEGC
jgi:hypothetical protein